MADIKSETTARMCPVLMNETRKKIIIKEIQYWKQSRLLPERYCNYLLALYTGGKQVEPTASPKHSFRLIHLILTLIIISALIVNYFTEIMLLMQISIFILLIGLLIGLCVYEFKKGCSVLLPLSLAMFILLLMSIKLYESLVPGKLLYLYGGLFFNCALWMMLGYKLKLIYFTIAGFFGSFIILYFTGLYFGYV